MTRSSGHTFQTIRKGFSALFLLCLSASLLSCGGGPQVASSTGHYLFVSNSNGIYAFSIQTNNTLSPVSTSAEQSLSVINGMVYVSTPGGQTTPTLYVIINNGTTIDAYPVNGGSIGTPNTVNTSTSSCSGLSSFTAITATPGGHYLLLTYGSSVVAMQLSGATTAKGCNSFSSLSSTPSGIAVDCAVPTGSNCNVLTTFPTTSSEPPEVVSWTEGGSFGTSISLTNITTSPPYALFSLSTTYFYLFSPTNKIVSSLLGSSTTSSPTSTQTIPSTSVSPCVDTLANQIYVPTSNGSIYQMGIQTNGSIGGANQLWSLGDTPPLNSIGTCAVED
ncbi:hypothetical protein LptCag_0716 [Leptospirillum ferriphilum]|jgi:hypothetical protein|uniref:Lipoprotein n=3 Tax=Leptospirillum TaxID=179 RepID=A0A094WC98_9BACT|nr:hypothetical protein [Leptospirillum ferriphilum]AFS54295.1 hypothetical protein LFML04_2099 [Leptospirillum ferriphilum ML-04]EDZ40318.1 MAG: Hypothetical protein CGL2_11346099 [Leptospirillum sp. Group II '5-way CG']KGA94090.1 hypothetical protein LptCag_0716 [Leptospirillum ferriphilum]